MLAAMAARTSRIRLGTAVMLLPLRPAALAAKEIASVDAISGGRLTIGVGIGGEYPKEFEAVGVLVKQRGARTDEAMRVIKTLFTEDNVTFDGRFTKLPGVTLAPKPVQQGGPPLWVAGRSEAAMRRAGELGDGYFPYLFSPEKFREGWRRRASSPRRPAAIRLR
jgi:probable F420-dependent oxidoreductase